MPGMMRSRKSGRSCPCCSQWMGCRAAEQRDWRRSERQQADPREYWDDTACEPAYYFKHDAPYIPFGGWWAAFLDDELSARSA